MAESKPRTPRPQDHPLLGLGNFLLDVYAPSPKPRTDAGAFLRDAGRAFGGFVTALRPLAEGMRGLLESEAWKEASAWFEEVLRDWPTDEHGRPLDPEEFHPGFAAMVAIESSHKDPKALDKYFRDWLGIPHPSDDRRQALWLIVSKEVKRPLSESSGWLLDSARTPRYLAKATKKMAWRIERDRIVGDEPWGLKRLRAKNLPKQCEFNAEVHGDGGEDPAETVGLTNAEALSALAEFQKEELERVLLKQAEGFLPERQYQVFALKFRGWTFKEIGKELGMTDGAAKAHMARVRQNPELMKMAGQWR